MGYFNYFIKCIIRKFVNCFFKPKTIFITLVIIFLLYLFGGTSRAEWTDSDIANLETDLNSILNALSLQLERLEQIKINSEEINNDINIIHEDLDLIYRYVNELEKYTYENGLKLDDILTSIQNVNTQILNIYNKLEENQQELLTELEKDNQAVLEELNMIRDAINGSEEELTTYTDLGIIYPSSSSSTTSAKYRLKIISLPYETKYTYTIKIYYKQTASYSFESISYYSDNLIPNDYIVDDYLSEFKRVGYVPIGTGTYILNFDVPSSNPKYLYLGWGERIEKIEVYRSIKGITESLNQSNDLQQQQNQLQQEQNDFLKQDATDSDVSVDGFNNVDSNDVTSSGLNGVFNNIYSSITSWNSKDISLPIPHTNKSIVIPANYTENMLSSFGGGWIITFVHTVYYFIVGRFMIYSITNIINSIKSGSILNTDSKNNITTDML